MRNTGIIDQRSCFIISEQLIGFIQSIQTTWFKINYKNTFYILNIFQTKKRILVIIAAVVFFQTTCVTVCRLLNENVVVLGLWMKAAYNYQTVMKTSQLYCSKSRYSTTLRLRQFAGRLLTDFKRLSHNNRNRYYAP